MPHTPNHTILKKRLLDKINHLGCTEHMEILKIIMEHKVPLTENKNGIFFNMTTLSPDVYKTIENFVNYCYSNKHELDKYDQKLHECKFYQKNTFLSQYSVNEPKDKKDALREIMERVDLDTKSTKIKDFVLKMSHASDKLNVKRSCGKFLMCKKHFMKKVDTVDNLPDCLEHEQVL
jgi:hypothetical protein